jgi:hypothetical protein
MIKTYASDSSPSPSPSVKETKDRTSPSYVYPEIGGRKKTRKNNKKIYRGGNKYRLIYLINLIIVIGLVFYITILFKDLNGIKTKYDVAMRQVVVDKLINYLKTGNSTFTMPVTNSEGIDIGVINTGSTAMVPVKDSANTVISYIPNPNPINPSKFVPEDIVFDTTLLDTLAKINNIKKNPFPLLFDMLSGRITSDFIDKINKLVVNFGDFLFEGFETKDVTNMKTRMIVLSGDFSNFSRLDKNKILALFFIECYPEYTSADDPSNVADLMRVANIYNRFYTKLIEVGDTEISPLLISLLPSGLDVEMFTSEFVVDVNEGNPNTYKVNDNGILGDESENNVIVNILSKLIPIFGTTTNTINTITDKVKDLEAFRELVRTKAICFSDTLKTYKGDKTREFTRLQADTVDYMVDISRMIGVPIVSNMFKQMKPLFSSVIDYVIYIKWLFILLVTIKGSNYLYENTETLRETVYKKLADVQVNIRQNIRQYVVEYMEEYLANRRQGQGQGQLEIGNGEAAAAAAAAEANGQILVVEVNRDGRRVLAVRQSPGRRAAAEARARAAAERQQLQIGNHPEGGGRRQTKKRRRQTKKPRRITRKRRRR